MARDSGVAYLPTGIGSPSLTSCRLGATTAGSQDAHLPNSRKLGGIPNFLWAASGFRDKQVLHSFPREPTSANGSPVFDQSTDASGYFEVTYRVSQVFEPVVAQ